MELRHLRYFVAVAAHGSFNRAAQILNLTQPALSRQVKDLEDEIGVPLLVRNSNYITLTQTGESFYEDVREVLARADTAVERARGERGTHILRVGYISVAVAEIMPAALEKFQAAKPRVRIELADLLPGEMGTAARQGRLDVVMLPEADAARIPGYQWTVLRPVNATLVMPATHPLARLKRIPPARLRDLPLIGLGGRSFPGCAASVRNHLRHFGVIPRFVVLIEDGLPSLFAAVEGHQAAAVLVDVVETNLPRNLVMRPFSPALALSKIMIGTPEDRANSHAAAFVQLLREQVKQLRPARKTLPQRGRTGL